MVGIFVPVLENNRLLNNLLNVMMLLWVMIFIMVMAMHLIVIRLEPFRILLSVLI